MAQRDADRESLQGYLRYSCLHLQTHHDIFVIFERQNIPIPKYRYRTGQAGTLINIVPVGRFSVTLLSRSPVNLRNKTTSLRSKPVLSDPATPSNLNTSTFLTVKDNIMLNPFFFGMLGSRAIQNIPNMPGYL